MTARVAQWAGVGGYRDSTTYFEGSSSEPQSTTQHFKCAVVECIGVPTTNQLIWSNDNALRGWQLQWNNAAGAFRFHQADGGGTLVQAQVAVAPRPRQLFTVAAAYNSPDTFINVGALSATAAGAGGFTAGIRNTAVGVLAASLTGAASRLPTVALLSADVGLDGTSLKAAHDIIVDNLREGRSLGTGLAFGLGRYWDADDWVPGNDWLDRIAGQALTPTGAPQRFGVEGRA